MRGKMEKSRCIKIAIRLGGQTATKIAEQIGVSKAQLANWASGFRSPGDQYISALANALDVDEAWIAGYPGSADIALSEGEKSRRMYIMKTLHIKDYGTLYQMYSFKDEALLSAIITPDGKRFLPATINGSQPKTREGIAEIDWISPQGSIITKIDGLPRMLP